MNRNYDVAVIGAGPAGSYGASLLATAGHRVLLLEQTRADAIAPRCTGVVGVPYVDLVGIDSDVILTEAKCATFLSPSGASMRVSSPEIQACVLDRALLEQRLRRRAVVAGAELREGMRVTRVARTGETIEVVGLSEGLAERYSCRALILAAGVSPGLLRQLGLSPSGRFLVGAHTEVEMDAVPETEVHFLPDLAPGAFAWLVPVGARRVRVGVLCARAAARLTGRFLDRSGVRERLVTLPDSIVQRPVPVSAPRRTYARGVVVVGDAAGQVKPTTGGGLYFGAIAAREAADVVGRALESGDLSSRALSVYERRWKSAFGRELRHGAIARGIYARLSAAQVDGIVARAERTGLADTLLNSRSFSFDRHSATLLTGLLRCLPAAFARSEACAEEAGE